jgi:hypothetical protein
MKRLLLFFAPAAGLLLLTGPQVRADLVAAPNAQWSYNFTPSAPSVTADSPGTGTISFTNEPGGSATGDSDLAVTNLQVHAFPGTSDTLNNATTGNYTISMLLTDNASNTSATLTFSGKLSGSFSSGNANVTDAVTGVPTSSVTPVASGLGTVTVALGANFYTVSLIDKNGNPYYTPPGPPSQQNFGSIGAFVSVQTDGSGHISGAPEPSTLVLSCLGLVFAGAASWQKRRRSLASLLA